MKVKKIISGVTTGILIIVFLVVLVTTVSSRISGGAPRLFGYELLTVLSGSMEPSIHTGSIIAVHPATNPTNLKVGDVATYRSTDQQGTIMITHRIKEVKGTGNNVQYIFKGDANQAPDEKPVLANQIVDTYVNITLPYLGYALAFVKSKTGVILTLVVPGAFLIIWQLVSLFRTVVRMEKEKADGKNSTIQDATSQNV